MKRRMFAITALLAALLLQFTAGAATVEKIKVPSRCMDKDVNVVCVCPDKLAAGWECPVIYLLHGFGGNENTWVNIKPQLPQIADALGVMFVCPDGQKSWYWDSPTHPESMYETFVSEELVEYVDENYSTKDDRKFRAITGLSMGGHGAMWLALRHKDVFGACGSTSGGLDIRPFPDKWDMKVQLGELEENREVWNEHTVINELDGLKNGELAIIFDCGYSDFFFKVNNNVHEKLLKMGVDHDFLTRPGRHNNQYWRNSIDYQILFFMKSFLKKSEISDSSKER